MQRLNLGINPWSLAEPNMESSGPKTGPKPSVQVCNPESEPSIEMIVIDMLRKYIPLSARQGGRQANVSEAEAYQFGQQGNRRGLGPRHCRLELSQDGGHRNFCHVSPERLLTLSQWS